MEFINRFRRTNTLLSNAFGTLLEEFKNATSDIKLPKLIAIDEKIDSEHLPKMFNRSHVISTVDSSFDISQKDGIIKIVKKEPEKVIEIEVSKLETCLSQYIISSDLKEYIIQNPVKACWMLLNIALELKDVNQNIFVLGARKKFMKRIRKNIDHSST